MILHPKYFNKTSLIGRLWVARQMKKFKASKLFKTLHLHKTVYPDQFYFYSPRLKYPPQFVGHQDLVKNWQTARKCETICPTQAIEVTETEMRIVETKCILCGLCVELAPDLLKMPGHDFSNRPTQDVL